VRMRITLVTGTKQISSELAIQRRKRFFDRSLH
jgi:hypothetical protein